MGEITYINKDIQEAVEYLDEEMQAMQKQKDLLLSLQGTEVVNEKQWHELCETWIRHSDFLGRLTKNIFPEAENINVSCNYVYFDIGEFKVQIPTSRAQGINVDTSWYKKDCGAPTAYETDEERKMKQYFAAKDAKAGWKELAKYRIGNTSYRTWVLFLLWFGKYKWKQPDRKFWEEEFKKTDAKQARLVQQYCDERKEMHRKANLLFTEILPIIERFSKKHYEYNGNSAFSNYINLEELRKIECPDTAQGETSSACSQE